jgi:hypothetical protein
MSIYIPPSIPERLHPKVIGLVGDPSEFCRLHRVQDKDSKREIPFNPLPMQVKIFNAVKRGHNRILVIKARQVAATTAAKFVLHQQWMATPPLRCCPRVTAGRVCYRPARRQPPMATPPTRHPAAPA